MKPVIFHVEAAGRFRPVGLAFATEKEARRARAWRTLEIETMWGGSPASSAPFYEKVPRIRPMKDLFIVHCDAMREMARTYFANQKHRLAIASEPQQTGHHESGRSKKTDR